MKRLLLTAAAAALALSGQALAQEATQMVSGPGVTCAPSTASATTGTETTASTTPAAGAGSSTMALSADNQVNAQTARTALSSFETNLPKFASVGKPTVVCIVELDTLAQSDTTLKDDITKFRVNNAQIKSKLEADTALIETIKAQHPTFDVNHVLAFDIGPSGELVLYVSRS
jgi:hypothetical protein